ncbi:MAG: hypothetical protein ACT4P2_02835 [Pseudomonadota bacterium]
MLHLYLKHRETMWLRDIYYGKREQSDLSPTDMKEVHRLVTTIEEAEGKR